MVGIDGILGKSSPFQVPRSFSMLVSRDFVRVDGAVNGGEVDEKLFRALQVRRDNSSSVTDSVPPDLSLGSTID
jgi:hypothetical protein